MGSEKEKVRVFTTKDLAQFDGTDGNPAYVAFEGTVYDVTGSNLWNKGSHFRRHLPGTDLTDQLGCAPHGADVLDRPGIEPVGVHTKSHAEDPIPPVLAFVFRKYPFLRRHTHPSSVHFPLAFLMAASAFTLLGFIFPDLLGIDTKETAYLMLVLAAIFTPFTIITGFFTWWVNYRFRPYKRIRILLGMSAVILVLEAACLYMGFQGPVATEGTGLIYHGLMILMGPVAAITGYNGGQMLFPTHK